MIIALLSQDNIYKAIAAHLLALLFMNNTHKATVTHLLENSEIMTIYLIIIKLFLH